LKKNEPKSFVTPLPEPALQRKVERLIREGEMPSLEDVCAAILETRKEFANKIRRARREAREKVAVKVN
jgi:hypothetical protein